MYAYRKDKALPQNTRDFFDATIFLMKKSVRILLHDIERNTIKPGELLTRVSMMAKQLPNPIRLPFPIVSMELTDQSGNKTLPLLIMAMESTDLAIINLQVFAAINSATAWVPVFNGNMPINPSELIEGKFVNLHPEEFFTEFSKGYGFVLMHPAMVRVLEMVNVLQCSNVHIEQRNHHKHEKRPLEAHKLDTYHVLTIDVNRNQKDRNGAGGNNSHRSPREHLRRGHIVRPDGRRPYWRNATLVNAGLSLGVVHKDYRVKSSAHHE